MGYPLNLGPTNRNQVEPKLHQTGQVTPIWKNYTS